MSLWIPVAFEPYVAFTGLNPATAVQMGVVKGAHQDLATAEVSAAATGDAGEVPPDFSREAPRRTVAMDVGCPTELRPVEESHAGSRHLGVWRGATEGSVLADSKR